MLPKLYEPSRGTVIVAHLVYALHSLSIVLGVLQGFTLLGSVLIIAGAFVFSWPSIVAVIMNYCFRSDAQGTYLASHFAWQIRTFWLTALYMVLIMLSSAVFLLIGVGLFIYWLGFLALGIWVAYRIIYGWMKLNEHSPLPL